MVNSECGGHMCVSITPVSRRRQDTDIVRVHRSGKNCVNKCSFKEIDRVKFGLQIVFYETLA